MSRMREAMISQAVELARLLADEAPAEAAANRLAGRPVRLIGIGTSWHAAHHGAWLLREAGIEAEVLHAADVAPYGRTIDPDDGVIVLSHTGGRGYSMTMLERARRPAPRRCTSQASATAATSRPSRRPCRRAH
jgi:glutamine---fructose-6-phosphate transaminase (isomerizing)